MNSPPKRMFLIKERERRKLSQTEVAKIIGISRSYYTKIENGLRTPSLEVAVRIANVMGCDVKQLV